MIRFKHYLKLSNLIFILLFSVNSLAQGNIKKGNITIVEVITKTKNNNLLWALHYIIVDNKVYSGDIFHGANFTCIMNGSYKDSIKDYLILMNELESLEKKLNNIKFKKFETKLKNIDTNYFWKCISVPSKYLKLNCNITTPDFFKFIYKEKYNGINLLWVKKRKIKECEFPKFFLSAIIENRKCLEKLNSSYQEFEECL